MDSLKAVQENIWFKKVLFVVQLLVLVSIMITSIVNIMMKTGNLPLWTALLGSSLGYLLPTPKLSKSMKSETPAHPSSQASSIAI